MNAEALTADQAAARCGYVKANGTGNGRYVRDLFRRGSFPAPIDAALRANQWRWNSLAVEAYIRGEWERGAA